MIKPLFSIVILCLTMLFSASAVPVRAQEAEGVAAVVNEDIVTLRDLEQRTRLGLLSANLPDKAETRAQIVPQVLRRLIDESLQLQEAKRLDITISDGDLDNGIRSIEQQNNMPKGRLESFLKERGIDIETIRRQIRSELSWVKVVRSTLLPTIRIGEEEIDHRLASIKANQGKKEYLAAEIFLAVDNAREDAEMAQLAANLLDQMRRGAHFSILARQFSQTGGASGGDLGWVSEGMLDEELTLALSKLEPGQVSPPIRLLDGYYILMLRETRIAGESQAREPAIDLAAINLYPLPGTNQAERARQLVALRSAIARAKNCEDYEQAVHRIGGADWNRPGMMPISAIPPEFLDWAKQAKPGQASDPIETSEFSRVLVLCDRNESKAGLPSREDIEQSIERERLELMAQRRIRDLRRAAFVEIRI
ncbi:MAG: peptidylprolyl isomerase [Rhodospirillaceae bacterium]|nr:peptidylprolyl isomerase [Rhodospirillaceae bacterium]